MNNINNRHRFALLILSVFISSCFIVGCAGSSLFRLPSEQSATSDSMSPEVSKDAYVEYAPSASVMAGADASMNYSQSPALLPQDRKLIRNASVDIETKTFDDLITNISSQVTSIGGYIESSNIYTGNSYQTYEYSEYGNGNYNQSKSASITARIPSDKLDAFINEVKSTGNVTRYSESVDDVTLQYSDVESHKKALETERDRLLELMEKAEDIDTILAIENQLSNIRYELDNYESQLKIYDNQIDYSTVSINVSEVIDYSEPKETPKTIGDRISVGFAHTLSIIKEGFINLLVWFIVNLPILLILAVIIIVLVIIARWIDKKFITKKTKEQNTPEPPKSPEQ